MLNNPTPAESVQHDVFEFLSSIPSATYVYAMLASVAASAFLYATGRRHTALFIGEWAPTLAAMGLFYKLLRPSGMNVGQRTGEAFSRFTR